MKDKNLQEEIARGNKLAEQLVEHLQNMGGAGSAQIPVTRVEPDGSMTMWTITVEFESRIAMS